MMRSFLPRLISSVVLAVLGTWLLAWQPFSADKPADPCWLELNLVAAGDGVVSLRVDEGHGMPPLPFFDNLAHLQRQASSQTVRVLVPSGRMCALQVGVFGCPQISMRSAQVRTVSGKVLAVFPLSSMRAGAHTILVPEGAGLRGQSSAAGQPFSLFLTPPAPVYLPSGNEPWTVEVILDLCVLGAFWWGLQAFLAARLGSSRIARLRGWGAQFSAAATLHPIGTLATVALVAALVNTFPVTFGDKSFVSPNNFGFLLYNSQPTLPGLPVEVPEDLRGSDAAAVMWAHIPYSVLESRALARDHEWPLWNRTASTGTPLFGQGQSMLGDPLNALTLLAGGAAWAWDVKYVLARALFAFGIGLGVWSLTRHLGVSALLAASSLWIGYFGYRYNHPAVFSVCYSPWVILPWLYLRGQASLRARFGWGAALILADWVELNSGTAKEASMLLLCLNAAGLLVVLGARAPWRVRLGRVAPLLWASILFFLLSAPCWMVFLDALRGAATSYDTPRAFQLNPGLLISFFDELFWQDSARWQDHLHPSLNFLVLTGLLWLAAAWPRWRADRATLALVGAMLIPAALVFGVVPPGWITSIPFLANIQHIHNTFGCVLLVLGLLLAGPGLRDCLKTWRSPHWEYTWRRLLLGTGLLAALYFGTVQAVRMQPPDGLHLGVILHSRFFAAYAPVLFLSLVLAPWGLRWLRSGGLSALSGAGVLLACLVAMHFRHGVYVATKFDPYVINLRTGSDLEAQSPALDRVRRRLAEPYRVAGFMGTLTPGYQGLLGLEAISSPDALMNRWYVELTKAAGLQREWDWRIIVSEETMPELKRFYDLLNLRFYLREAKLAQTELPAGLTPVGQTDMEIFESREAWPRAFFTSQCGSYETLEQFAELVQKGDGRPFAAVQGPSPAPLLSGPRQVAPARDYRLTTNRTAFTITAPGPGVVVLEEAYEPENFRVTVNGVPTPYFRVNHAFKGLRLEQAGEYRIEYAYWPRLLNPALKLALLGLLLACATPAAVWWVGRRLRAERVPATPAAPSLQPAAAQG